MSKRILLITGWGGGTDLLIPLQQQLQQVGHDVERLNIFNALDDVVLQKHVEIAKQFDVIAGWSLGGQLATLLIDQIQQQDQQQKILITFASNPCFVIKENWQTAMPIATFEQFKQSFYNDAISTLQRFGYMVCQGSSSVKKDLITLQSLIRPQPITLLKQGLQLLESLNLVEIQKNYTGHQLHIFAEQDSLVPYQITQKIQDLPAKNQSVILLNEASHGFPCFMPQQTVEIMQDFIQQSI